MCAARAVGGLVATLGGSLPCSTGAGDDDGVALAPQRQARERVTGARAGRAVAGGGLVERAVRGADQRAAVLGEEVVGPEVERGADVRAAVDVGVVVAVVIHDESLEAAPAALEPELRRAAGRQLGGGTSPLRRGRHGPHVTIEPC